jgi:undecaprenyl phosphate-alpha-L-ara4FN deformylase
MDLAAVRAEFAPRAGRVLPDLRLGGADRGAAGWQSNALSREVYDEAGLLYSSDTRGTHPFFPRSAAGLPDARDPEHAADARRADGQAGVPRFRDRRAPPLAPAARPAERLHAPCRDRGHGPARALPGAARGSAGVGRRVCPARRRGGRLLAEGAFPVCDQVMAPVDGGAGLSRRRPPEGRLGAVERAPAATTPSDRMHDVGDPEEEVRAGTRGGGRASPP